MLGGLEETRESQERSHKATNSNMIVVYSVLLPCWHFSRARVLVHVQKITSNVALKWCVSCNAMQCSAAVLSTAVYSDLTSSQSSVNVL